MAAIYNNRGSKNRRSKPGIAKRALVSLLSDRFEDVATGVERGGKSFCQPLPAWFDPLHRFYPIYCISLGRYVHEHHSLLGRFGPSGFGGAYG